VLWPNELPDAWEGALSAVISKLRRLLAEAGLVDVLDGSDGAYELRLPEGSWVDVRAAVNALDRAEGLTRAGRLRDAWAEATVSSSILRRPLLPGEELPWVEARRRELRELELRNLDCLSRIWLGIGEATLAGRAARRLVELAPFRESAHARLMESHLATGDAAEAIRVYGELRELLAEELGVSPSAEVQALYERALGG
jgi:DNA-binding SARP family transcriptional activator